MLDFTQTEADVDRLRAARFKKAADKGDKEAAAGLRRMEETKMKKYGSKMHNVPKPNEGEKELANPSDDIFHLNGDQLIPMPARSMREGLLGKSLEDALQTFLERYPQIIPGETA